jgi:large subunit ribosomal protein L15
LGRGLGSGRGTTSGKGQKGQKARSGFRLPPGFEGGQLPLIKRLPHQRGFRNRFRVEYQVVNVKALERFDDGADVSLADMRKAGLVRTTKMPVKILGQGALSKRLVVHANKFSASAKKAIEDTNGAAQVISEEADAAAATV